MYQAIVGALGWGPRRTVTIAYGLLLVAIWLVVLRLGLQGTSDVAVFSLRLLVLLAAFLCTLAVVRYGRRGFWGLPVVAAVALLANVSLTYAAVTWAISHSSFGILAGFLVGAVCVGLFVAGFRLYLPGYSARCFESWEEAWQPLSARERDLLGRGKALFLILAVAWMFAVVAFSEWIGPVPIAILILFGLAVTYGVFTYVVRRTFLIVVALVALFGLVAHVQLYPMRFPNLEPEYRDICELGRHLREDIGRQDVFDRVLLDLWSASDQTLVLGQEITQKLAAMKEADDLREREKAKLALPALYAKLGAFQAKRRDLEQQASERWEQMEDANRVRAGRLVVAAQEETASAVKQSRRALALLKPAAPPGGKPEAVNLARRFRALLQTPELEQWEEGLAGPAGAAFRYPYPSKKPLVVVAVSGGGIRSAAWVFAVLKKLELALAAEGIDFPSHVRIITGASGGMVGASYYVVTLPEVKDRDWATLADPEKVLEKREATLDRQEDLLMNSDFLTPLLRRSALTDLPAWISPWPARHDRGRELERGWATHLRDLTRDTPAAIDVPFACPDPATSLKEKERQGHVPSLVFTPMIIEDGRRLVISNLDLRSAISNDGLVVNHKGTRQILGNHSTDAVQLFRLFPDAAGRFRVGTAARMSASFPYFSPAVSLPTFPRRRIVDAGYYDNYGVHLASSWVAVHLERLLAQWDSILFLQIRDGVTEDERQLRKIAEGGDDPGGRTIEELTSPPEGLISSWSYSSMFRNDGQLAQLTNTINREHLIKEGILQEKFSGNPLEQRFYMDKARPFGVRTMAGAQTQMEDVLSFDRIKCLVVNFELEADVSLSWYLSKSEQDDIRSAERKIEGNIGRMIEWWKTPLAKFR